MTNIEIEWRVNLRIIEFHQHIIACDAELGGAKRDETGDIETAHADQIETGIGGSKAQFARFRIGKGRFGLDADALQQRHYLFKDAPIRQRHDQRFRGWAGSGAAGFHLKPSG